MAMATTADVENRLGRSLVTETEMPVAVTLLDDVEGLLLSRLPTLLTRAEDDVALAARIVAVEAAAVVRVLRNPDGYRSEATGPFSTTYDTRAAAGFLTVLAEEWASLGVSSAWTITPALEMPTLVPPRLTGWL